MWRDRIELSLILSPGRGWLIELFDVGQPLIAAMVNLFTSLVSPSHPPTDYAALEAAAHAWFDAVAGDHDAEDAYFANFAGLWLQLWRDGLRSFAVEVWPYSLKAAQSWEAAHPGRRIHKGSPYYYWAGSLIVQGDLDIGFMLMHQALREDTLSSGQVRRDMPAWKFSTLDPDPAQFMKPAVDQITDFLTTHIDRYNRECSRSLSLGDVRAKLLAVPALYEPAIVLVYAAFRSFRLVQAPLWLRDSDFAALLKGSALVTFYTVAEAYLRHRFPTVRPQLRPLVQQLSIHLSLSLHQADPIQRQPRLDIMNDAFKMNPDAILRDAINGRFTATVVSALELALGLAAPLRNHGAHGLESLPVVAEHFDEVLQFVMNGTLAVLDFI